MDWHSPEGSVKRLFSHFIETRLRTRQIMTTLLRDNWKDILCDTINDAKNTGQQDDIWPHDAVTWHVCRARTAGATCGRGPGPVSTEAGGGVVAPAKVTAERGCCRRGRWWRRRWVARLRERPGPGPAQRPRQQRSPILRTTELRNHGPSYLAADSFSGGHNMQISYHKYCHIVRLFISHSSHSL